MELVYVCVYILLLMMSVESWGKLHIFIMQPHHSHKMGCVLFIVYCVHVGQKKIPIFIYGIRAEA